MSHSPLEGAALLTVGTEITSGQIVNTNASWLSDQLHNYQIPVNLHLSVPDEERQILDALNFIAKSSQLIFITGGLGPTRDDLTRNVVATWLGEELEFDEASWQGICQKLTAFGVHVSSSNRQQCFFPRGSRILPNAAGTANAFSAQKGEHWLWCLPGPPREIKQIWDDHLAASLLPWSKSEAGLKLLRWHCLGKSESAIGELVEEIIQDTPLISGYRPHLPYVEVKIWCPNHQLKAQGITLNKLEEALGPWLVCRGDEDLAELLLAKAQHHDLIQIDDKASHGVIGERLGSAFRRVGSEFKSKLEVMQSWDQARYDMSYLERTLAEASPHTLALVAASLRDDGQWPVGLAYKGRVHTEYLELPFKANSRIERQRRYIAEKTLHCWSQSLAKIDEESPES